MKDKILGSVAPTLVVIILFYSAMAFIYNYQEQNRVFEEWESTLNLLVYRATIDSPAVIIDIFTLADFIKMIDELSAPVIYRDDGHNTGAITTYFVF